MRNVFLLYMPPSNAEAMVHYQDTIMNRVPLERLSPFLPKDLTAKLRGIFGRNPIAVWGSRPGSKNRSNYEIMNAGDDILIIEGARIRLIGKVAAKARSAALAHELWKPVGKVGGETWELVYFIANPQEVNVPFAEFGQLFGYKRNYQLRGFTTVTANRLVKFYEQYDDLYSILQRLESGVEVRRKEPALERSETPPQPTPLEPEQIEQVPKDDLISDHVRMQWKLARLGLQAGEQVWVPVADQKRLKEKFDFDEFDAEFAAGIDLPPSCMENIDVVLRQEFRVGAAYEIENSTAIYSGLLRFADLNILAPNTLYPMIVVAPQARRNQLRAQLERPVFRRLGLDKTVSFLSYEEVDRIDDFFKEPGAGLTVEIIRRRAEKVA